MAQLKAIIQCIEQFAPPHYQESYDNSRLLVGDPEQTVTKVLLTLDCLEEVVDEAVQLGCELIVAHHPIVFSGLKSITGKNYVERVILKAIRHGIAIYACHTNLDNVQKGVNDRIAQRIGLTECKVLAPMKNTLKQLFTYVPVDAVEKVRASLYEAGAGSIGNYSECSFTMTGTGTYMPNNEANPFLGEKGVLHQEKEIKIEVVFPVHREKHLLAALFKNHPYEEVAYGMLDIEIGNQALGAGLIGQLPEACSEENFLQQLKKSMQTACIRHTRLLGNKVKTVAVCGGAGSFLLQDAIRAGANCFVSADFKYHEFFDAENHLVIADIGHYESEQFTYEIFSDLLLKNFTTFAVLKSSVNTNPVNYYS